MENNENSNEARSQYKRRKLLINLKVQFVFLIYGVSLALFTLWGASIYRDAINGSTGQLGSYSAALGICVGFTILVLAGVFISNLIVGPIYRIMSHMDRVSDGKEFRELTFRRFDFFQEILPSYHRFAKTLLSRSVKDSEDKAM
jgi:methyl-accepting chemotaxis protein